MTKANVKEKFSLFLHLNNLNICNNEKIKKWNESRPIPLSMQYDFLYNNLQNISIQGFLKKQIIQLDS